MKITVMIIKISIRKKQFLVNYFVLFTVVAGPLMAGAPDC